MDQQFCLKWNNHHSAFISLVNDLLFSEKLVDVFLMADDEVFGAHKMVLSACSSYFEKVFTKCSEKNLVIMINDISSSNLKCLMNYMYYGEVKVTQEQLPSLIKAAESLKIKGLSAADKESYEENHPVGKNDANTSRHENLNVKVKCHLNLEGQQNSQWYESENKTNSSMEGGTDYSEYENLLSTDYHESSLDGDNSNLPIKLESKSPELIETDVESNSRDNGNTSSFLMETITSVSRGHKRKSTDSNNEDLSHNYKILNYANGPRYVCLSCDRHYKHKVLVIRHLRYECGNKKTFQCPICHKMFSHRFNLQAHEKRLHPQVLYPSESNDIVHSNIVSPS